MLQTPLDVALACAPQPIVRLLRSKGALSGSELAPHPAAAAGMFAFAALFETASAQMPAGATPLVLTNAA